MRYRMKGKKKKMASLNLEFYNEKYFYSDGEVELEIIEYAKAAKNSNYDDVLSKDLRWPVFYHLSDVRQNILNWCTLKPGCSILEIGAGMGAITPVLCKKAASVTSVELSRTRAQCIYERCKEYDNLEIIVGNLNEISFSKKFDYITLIGVLEYAPSFTESDRPFETFLSRIKGLLNPKGSLIIAIENRFGLKYWCGAAEDHIGKPFAGIAGYEKNSHVKTFDKASMNSLLEKSGFLKRKYYYPYPDYKLPRAVYSDSYRPDGMNSEKSRYYYDMNADLIANEELLFPYISNNKVDDFFANSFLIFAGEEESLFPEECFAMFSDSRSRTLKIGTKILEKGMVEKFALFPEGREHIGQTYENSQALEKQGINIVQGKLANHSLSMEYISGETLDKVILGLIMNCEREKAYDLIKQFYDLLLRSSEQAEVDDFIEEYNVKETGIDYGVILKTGYFDFTFFNCFYDGNFQLFDQEFVFPNLPALYILFRSIIVCYIRNSKFEEFMPLEDILNAFSITKELEEVFRKVEKKILESSGLGSCPDYLANHSYYETLDAKRVENEKMMKELEDLRQTALQYYELKDQYNSILQSKSWRIMSPLRKGKGLFKSVKNTINSRK